MIDRQTGQLNHRIFREIGDYLHPGDLLVANDSRVIPARLKGRKVETGGAVEVLLLQPETPETWRALVKPGRRVRAGMELEFGPLRAEVLDEIQKVVAPGTEHSRTRRLRFSLSGDELDGAIERLGETPLPPYIHAPLADAERYQTVYARPKGSVAAPTAGLHFTTELLASLQAQGIVTAYITCHIGLHTFRPIQADEIEQHDIHEEWCLVPAAVADLCNQTRAQGGRIVAAGTSSVRALEAAWNDGAVRPFQGWTQLYIYPGYEYRAVDAMITNFHLPRTTLMALVSAFASKELILRAYHEALVNRYRFYSFGDATLIL